MFGNNSFGNTSFGSTSFGTGFGSTSTFGAFGSTTQAPNQPQGPIGTTIRFVPLSGTDNVPKTASGGSSQITTRHQNISAMKEYESKSVDELRLEDYAANRKVGQPQSSFSSAPFGTMQQPSTSQQNSSIFGSNNRPTTNLFSGSPFQVGTSFNSSTPAATGGSSLFNNSPQTNTTPFGANNLSTPNKTLFGGPATTTTSIFGGSPATSSTPFGLNQTQNLTSQAQPFGQTNTSSIFANNTNQQPQTSLFGSNTASTSTSQPFSFPTTNPQQQTSSLFNTSLTNDANKPAFSMPNSNSMFNFGGNTANNSLNQSTNNSTGIFNTMNKPATTVANSSPFQIGSPFGATNSNTGTGSSLFNSGNQTNTPFGTNPLNTQSKTNLFGPQTTTTTSIFGNNSTTNTTPFGLNQTQNLTSQAQPFGQTNTSSIFANPGQTQTSLFGANTASTSSTQPFSFPSSGTQQTSSLFNTSITNDASKTFSMPNQNSSFNFGGASAGTTSSIFGQPTTTTANNNGPFSGLSNNLSFGQNNSTSLFGPNHLQNMQNNSFQQQNQPFNVQQQSPQSPQLLMNRFKSLPYGESSQYLNDSGSNIGGSLKFTTDPKAINQYKMSAKTTVKLNKPASSEKTRTDSVLFDGLEENTNDDLRCAIDVFVPKKSIKKLDIKSNSHLSEGDAQLNNDSPLFERTRSNLNSRSNRDSIGRESAPTGRHVRYADHTFPGSDTPSFVANSTNLSTNGSDLSSFHNTSYNLSNASGNQSHSSNTSGRGYSNAKSGIVNTRSDYKLKPSLSEIERCYNSENDTCYVDSFLIERPNYGSILFESRLDVKGLNLDEIVHIRRKEVVVYPDDENKPPVGQGLNRPAIITLHQVWPIDKSNNEVIKDIDRLTLMKYPEKIEHITIEKGARFIEYRSETGSWVFGVKHFSKYGITDDDEEIGHMVIPSTPNPNQQQPSRHMQTPQNLHLTQSSLNSGLLNRLKTSNETNLSSNSNVQTPHFAQSPTSSIAKLVNDTRNVAPFKVSPKTNINFRNLSESERHETSLSSNPLDEIEENLNMSLRCNSIDNTSLVLFESEEISGRNYKRPLAVHGTKRLALQNLSSNKGSISPSYEKPVAAEAPVPKQNKIREIKMKPDLYAAKNKIARDIMSVCVSGSPKIRFFKGSRGFCYIQGDSVVVNELKLVPTNPNGTLADDIRERFETYLDENSLVTSVNMSPVLAPYIETHDYIPNASSHELLHALYGNLDSKTPYAKQDERLTRVVRWLASVNRKIPEPSNLYQLIMHHMSCDRYDLASNIATENNHPRLALLIATLNLNKELMSEQLASWRLTHADKYIDTELLKIYILLSGRTEWKISNEDTTVYSLKGLRWTQQLCLLALHVPSFITEPEKYGFHMLPFYIQKLDTNTNDVDYHILARHSPANILSAAKTLTEEWFLLESLKSFHVINSESECIESDIIHCNLASQLGPIDLRWACFVALHIINNEVRNQVLIRCLEQNYNQLREERYDLKNPASYMTVESWLIEKLKLPREFVENSKSLAEKSN